MPYCPDISYDVTKQYPELLKTYNGATKLCQRPGSDLIFPLNEQGCIYPDDCDSLKILGKALINAPGNLLRTATGLGAGVAGAATVGLVEEVGNSIDNAVHNKNITTGSGESIRNAFNYGYGYSDTLQPYVTVANPNYGKKSKKAKKAKHSKKAKKAKKAKKDKKSKKSKW
jgi:hypothetical protein